MDPLVVALFVSVAMGSAATIFAWRQRPEPGATPLVVLLLGQSWWSASIIFKLQAVELPGKLFWTNIAVFGVVVIPVAWLLFALEYTGRDRYIRPRNVGLLLVIPAVTVILVLTAGWHDLYYVHVTSVGPDGVHQLQQGGLGFWVLAGYTYLLGILGVVPLFGLLTSGAVTFQKQSAALLVGIFTPWITNILFLAGAFPNTAIDPTPIAFSISGVAYLSALTRHRLLGTSPAPNQRARQHLFDQMHMGAIVVDRNDNVVDMNDTFEAIIGRDRHTVLGTPADDWVPEYESLPRDGTLDGNLAFGNDGTGGAYDVTVTPISDVRGRRIGRVIAFHDISEHLRQQQRLGVLNRILRHNLRTETNLIHGYATELAGEEAQIIQDRAMRVADFAEKGRTAIDLFDATHGPPNPDALTTVLEHAIDTVQREYAVTVNLTVPETDVFVAGVLTPVVVNLLENAAAHHPGDATVDISARIEGDSVVLWIADDGPGISEAEIGVLESGTETALEHGSGLGLWIVKWGVDIAEGAIAFASTDDAGTRVTITVPVLDAPGAEPESGADAGA
jgi:PAS domain S-box-containing protein